jgi:hypothetical protein
VSKSSKEQWRANPPINNENPSPRGIARSKLPQNVFEQFHERSMGAEGELYAGSLKSASLERLMETPQIIYVSCVVAV